MRKPVQGKDILVGRKKVLQNELQVQNELQG